MSALEQLEIPETGDELFAGIDETWQARAAAFHADNPHVYVKLRDYTRQMRRAGRERVGIELIWNRMRWDWLLQTSAGEDEFKLNQNFKAWYARLLMRNEADLAGVFELRDRSRKSETGAGVS